MSDEGHGVDGPRIAVWGIVAASLAGMWLATHVFVIWALDLVLMATLTVVLVRAKAGCNGWFAAALGGFLGATVPFGLMIALGDRFEPSMSRHGVDTFALPFFVMMVVMPNAMILCGWAGAACTHSLSKRDDQVRR